MSHSSRFCLFRLSRDPSLLEPRYLTEHDVELIKPLPISKLELTNDFSLDNLFEFVMDQFLETVDANGDEFLSYFRLLITVGRSTIELVVAV